MNGGEVESTEADSVTVVSVSRLPSGNVSVLLSLPGAKRRIIVMPSTLATFDNVILSAAAVGALIQVNDPQL